MLTMLLDLGDLASAIDAACRIQGRFTLRSRITTTEHFDKYGFESDPNLLREMAMHMVPPLPADTQDLGGLELGCVPIATTVSALTGLPAIFVRKEAKNYGTCRMPEGGDLAAGRSR
jgi:orotate phosphoribosyltransferase